MKKLTIPATTALLTAAMYGTPAMAEGEYDADAFVGGSISYSKLENLSIGGEEVEELGDDFVDEHYEHYLFHY